MRLSVGLRVALVAVVLVGALVAMVAMRQLPLMTGREVVLATVPVDPRDLLRGDYVDLAYDVSRLRDSDMPLPDVMPGDTVYVPLAGPDADGLWHPAGVLTEAPIGPAPFLRGTVTGLWDQGDCPAGRCRTVSVAYGIESYFVPEDGGRELETLAREGGRLAVVVAVDASGGAVIAGLRIDGRRVSREGLF